MLNAEVRNLEEDLVKLDALLAFINSDGVKDEIEGEKQEEVEKLANSIKTDYKVIEQKTYELTQQATFEDFVFMKTNAASIKNSKSKIYDIVGPCMVQALETRVFCNLTGKLPRKLSDSIEHIGEDNSVIFDSLAGNEYEFCTLLMEPKNTLKEKVDEIFDLPMSPQTASSKITILTTLQKSKSMYEVEMTSSKEENMKLMRELEDRQKEHQQMKQV